MSDEHVWKDKIPHEQVESDPSKQDKLEGTINRLIKLGVLNPEASQVYDDGNYVTVGLATPRDAAKLQVGGTISASDAVQDYELPTFGQVKAIVSNIEFKTINNESILGSGNINIAAPTLQSVLDAGTYAALLDGPYSSVYNLSSSGVNQYVQQNNDSYGFNTSPWYGFMATSSHRLNTENTDNESNSIQVYKEGPVFRRVQYIGANAYESILKIGVPISNSYYTVPSPAAGGTFFLPLSVNGAYADASGDITIAASAAPSDWLITSGPGEILNKPFVIPSYLDVATNNMAVGVSTLSILATGQYNAAFGIGCLPSNTTGLQNTSLGSYSLYSNTTGSYNFAMGSAALFSNTTSSYNFAAGSFALYYNTTGTQNTAIGASSMGNNVSSSFNIAIGSSVLGTMISGYGETVAIGAFAMYEATGTDKNVAIGTYALRKNTSGFSNNAVGNRSLIANTSGHSNNAFGNYALEGVTIGVGNIGIGKYAGRYVTTGNSNIYIGSEGLVGDATVSNIVNIGEKFKVFSTGLSTVPAQTTALITGDVSGKAILIKEYISTLFTSPALTGTPTAPTATAGTNTTQVATTAFVLANSTNIPHLEFNNTDKTVWNNGKGDFGNNTSFGQNALKSAVIGNNLNSVFGTNAGANLGTGTSNTLIGYNSFINATTLNFTTAIGSNAGTIFGSSGGNVLSNISGVYIGQDTRPLLDNTTNEIVIGANAIGGGSNTATLGSSSITSTILRGNVTTNGNVTAAAHVTTGGTVNQFVDGTGALQTIKTKTKEIKYFINGTVSQNTVLGGNFHEYLYRGYRLKKVIAIFGEQSMNTNKTIPIVVGLIDTDSAAPALAIAYTASCNAVMGLVYNKAYEFDVDIPLATAKLLTVATGAFTASTQILLDCMITLVLEEV